MTEKNDKSVEINEESAVPEKDGESAAEILPKIRQKPRRKLRDKTKAAPSGRRIWILWTKQVSGNMPRF